MFLKFAYCDFNEIPNKDCVTIIPRGVKYNTDKNRYEYIRGTDGLLGSEGWHLDVLKRWLTPTDKLKPHGWRFACRDRNEAAKTQGNILQIEKEAIKFFRLHGKEKGD